MENEYSYLIIAALALFVVLLIVLWRWSRKRLPSASEHESLESTKVVETPKRRPSFSKAIAHWVPLLKEQSKDRDRWEEVLITSDMGPQLTGQLIDGLQKSEQAPQEFFKTQLKQILQPAKAASAPWENLKPWVLYIVGVNGVGKTSSVVKLGAYFQSLGKEVGVIAGDTFRKAAIEQLERGCEKQGLEVSSKKAEGESSEGVDPSSVIFDGLSQFKEQKDIILVDTSGRLHNKKNLMQELQKMKKVGGKQIEGCPHDLWLVIDATLGQNALNQARLFHEAVDLTGVILTKMDGLSKGGVIFQLFQELKRPIWFIGLGEKASDLERFEPENFVEDLFDLEAS